MQKRVKLSYIFKAKIKWKLPQTCVRNVDILHLSVRKRSELSEINHFWHAGYREINERKGCFLTLVKFFINIYNSIVLLQYRRIFYAVSFGSNRISYVNLDYDNAKKVKLFTQSIQKWNVYRKYSQTCINHVQDIQIALTFLRRVKGIIFWHVLDVILQRGLWKDNFVLVDLVNGVLEGQLRAAILLVMSEYSTWKVSIRI